MFVNMRKFHNNIKRSLYNKYTKSGDNLLDLACGKGGDLNKWVMNNLNSVSGYDISTESIEESQRRYKDSYNDKIQFSSHVRDLSTCIISGNKTFDVVSSMFAFHYFFENENTFEIIMTSIKQNLKLGGYFIGTLFDGDTINNLMINNNNKYTLETNNITDFEINKLSDNAISVYIRETVLNEPMIEYIVSLSDFKNKLYTHGFKLIETTLFSELHVPVARKFKLDINEKKISFLNRTFVFQRIF